MTTYFEAHITVSANDVGHPAQMRSILDNQPGWKFSMIDGDPVLGAGTKCYATKQFPSTRSPKSILTEIDDVADVLTRGSLMVVRRKIEHVIFDDRSSKVSFEGG